jgi:hypothetical protein
MGRKSTETKLKEQHLAKIAAAEARAEKTRLETAIKSGEYVLRRGVKFYAAGLCAGSKERNARVLFVRIARAFFVPAARKG